MGRKRTPGPSPNAVNTGILKKDEVCAWGRLRETLAKLNSRRSGVMLSSTNI